MNKKTQTLYRMLAIISRGLYTFLLHYLCTVTFGLMYGLYSRAASNQEWLMMVHDCGFFLVNSFIDKVKKIVYIRRSNEGLDKDSKPYQNAVYLSLVLRSKCSFGHKTTWEDRLLGGLENPPCHKIKSDSLESPDPRP